MIIPKRSNQNNWYLLKVKPCSYDIAIKNLSRQGFETFAPLSKVTKNKSNRYVESFQPLFSGYIFVYFALINRNWQKINNTFGVSKLINFNGKYKPLPLNLIEALRERCNKNNVFIPHNDFKKGDKVQFINGPFVNFIAEVNSMSNEKRIWVLLDIMNRKTLVSTSSAQIISFA